MRTVVENKRKWHEIHKFDDTGFVYENEYLPENKSCFYDFGESYPMTFSVYSAESVSDFAESLKVNFYS